MKRIVAAITLILVLLISLIGAITLIGMFFLFLIQDELNYTMHELTKAIVND